MLAALAFVPLPDVIDAFESVADEFPLDAQEVVNYFENTYMEDFPLVDIQNVVI